MLNTSKETITTVTGRYVSGKLGVKRGIVTSREGRLTIYNGDRYILINDPSLLRNAAVEMIELAEFLEGKES